MAQMQVKRKHLGVAVSNESLFAVGGRDEGYELSSVERYLIVIFYVSQLFSVHVCLYHIQCMYMYLQMYMYMYCILIVIFRKTKRAMALIFVMQLRVI